MQLYKNVITLEFLTEATVEDCCLLGSYSLYSILSVCLISNICNLCISKHKCPHFRSKLGKHCDTSHGLHRIQVVITIVK
jgi:hypothetical protein